MAAEDGLICAYLLDGRGGGQEIGWPGSETLGWLHEASGLEPLMRDALLTEEVRPRELAVDDALLVILRGVNLTRAPIPRTW
jgi:zinc transporter